MVSSLSFQSIATVNSSYSGIDGGRLLLRRNRRYRATVVSCRGQNPTNEKPQTSKGPEPENVLLKIAWYGSELLGIAASVFRSPASPPPPTLTGFEVPVDCSGRVVRVAVVDSIKQDFKRSYFVTGQWKKHNPNQDSGSVFCLFFLNRIFFSQGTWRRRFMRRSVNLLIRLVPSRVLLVSKGIALISDH